MFLTEVMIFIRGSQCFRLLGDKVKLPMAKAITRMVTMNAQILVTREVALILYL